MLEGCYLYYDAEERMGWVRSGKVAGNKRDIGTRHDEHKASALLQLAAARRSAFYSAYPRKESSNYSNASRRGWFDGK